MLEENCSTSAVVPDNYYCVGAYPEDYRPPPPTVTVKPAAAPSDTISTCVSWYHTTSGDACELIAIMFGTFAQDDFQQWNPSVGGDCSGLQVRHDLPCHPGI